MMTRIYLLVALILYCVSNSALSEPTTWLIQGDVFTDEEATSRLIQLDSQKSYFPVSTRAEIYYRARPGKLVSCVIAASVHQNGQVSVVEGGYGTKKVRIRYITENGRPDVFFVLVQAAKRESVYVEGDLAWSTRLGIAYEPMKNWTVAEIQNALRNVTSSQFPFA
ncbi:uncharacterized protein LOC115236453 [Formica exsecta]|uniref:uncharacterized protein LOC115236452 n=1 Tax=Formica exsecta TaxID=72781 RepID=UPI001143A1B3|nr:uncharacterized protein LOC115236452 [Formica exsecta]XP_029664783.1 uncharacterized protein LOC115236453 [Formica exsecta]